MTTTPIARVLDRIRYNCPGVLDGIARLELYNSMVEFLQRSNIWLFELPIDIVTTSNDYILDTGQPVVVNRLMGLGCAIGSPNLNLAYVPMNPPQFLMDNNPQAGSEVNNPVFRVPRQGILLNAGTPTPVLRIMINPGPNQIYIATLSLCITDPMDADGLPIVPEWIMEKYKDALGDGAISRLMAQGGKPYSNDQGAGFHGRKFNQGVGLARQEVRTMLLYGGQRWVYPRGWTTYSTQRAW